MALLRCKTPFLFDGRTYHAQVDIVDSDDPIATSHAAFFEAVATTREASITAAPVVEQATAAPGEKRTRARTD